MLTASTRLGATDSGVEHLWDVHDTTASGRLIVFCGLDGSGKTTQMSSLQVALEAAGRRVIITKQPTDDYRLMPIVRDFLERGGDSDQATTLALLAAADRRQHIRNVIKPALLSGADVLCDRYVYSSLAYFSARGISMEDIVAFNKPLPKPTVAFFLDLNVRHLQKRLLARGQRRLKREEREVHCAERIRAAFLSLSDQLVVLDASLPVTTLHRQILSHVHRSSIHVELRRT